MESALSVGGIEEKKAFSSTKESVASSTA